MINRLILRYWIKNLNRLTKFDPDDTSWHKYIHTTLMRLLRLKNDSSYMV